MPKIKLIADSGSTKTEWCLLIDNKPRIFYTQGLSPYFLSRGQIESVLKIGVLTKAKKTGVDEIHFYGTGCKSTDNKKMFKDVLQDVFKISEVTVDDDLTGAARSLCGSEKGIVCILGTGSNSCYFNGKKILKNSPGLGFILGDEGSGAVLGKSLIQHYLYDLMDDDLRSRFDAKFVTNASEILEAVYRKPMPNRYLASFAIFLAENRGHYMVENIIADGLNSFFFTHLLRYKESFQYPLHFTGGVSYGFQDVILALCKDYGFEMGNILKTPMEGLIRFHKDQDV